MSSSNIFAQGPQVQEAIAAKAVRPAAAGGGATAHIGVIDYSKTPSGLFDHIVAFAFGFALGFGILFVYYQIIIVSTIGGVVFGLVNIFTAAQNAIKKRKRQLRTQFFDMLESMSVSMRAGNPPLKALENAREDLLLIYAETSDIMVELDLIIRKFNNAVRLSDCFDDLAKRSMLDDITSFASVYATIEGKSSRADEIVRETQQIIADKLEIEMEIETMLTSAKSEVNMMLLMPIIVLAIMATAGGEIMGDLYTSVAGRIVSSIGLFMLIACYLMARAFSNVKL